MSLTARFSRTSAAALALLVALAMLAVGAAPARADVDSLPPALVGLHLTPDSVSTADAAQTITVVADVDDDVNGLSSYSSYVTFQSPSGMRSYQAAIDSSKRLPGTTAQHGSYQSTVTLPRFSEKGTWKISVSLYDGMHSRYYSTTDLTTAGLPAGLEQTALGDSAAPVLTSFDISPAQTDTSTAPQIVTVTARIKDDVSGFSSTYFSLNSPSGAKSLYINLDSSKRMSGNAQDGTYVVPLTLPRYSEQGTWRIGSYGFSLADVAGNNRSLSPGDLTLAGFPTSFTQSAPGDTTPPTLVSFDVSPGTVNTSAAAQTVTVTARIKDDVSGFTSTSLNFTSASGAKSLYAYIDASRRLSGTAQDGTYVVDMTLPRFSEQGTWRLNTSYGIGLNDVAGNNRTVTLGDMVTAGFPTSFTQTAPGDAAPPVLAALSFSTDTIDTSASPQTINVRAHITDDLAGLSSSCCMTSSLTFQSPSANYGRTVSVTFETSTRVSGTSTDGVYEVPVTLPRYSEQGTWKLTSGSLNDAASNYKSLSSSDFAAAGFPTTIQQTGIGDTTPPVLTIESVTPAQVDTSTSSKTVTVRAHVTDDLSGVGPYGSPSFTFKSPALAQYTSNPSEATRLVSGDARDGVYDVALTVPRFAELGVWKLSGVSVSDALGNSGNPSSMPSAAGYSASFEVTTLPPGTPTGDPAPPGVTVPDAPVAAVATPGNGQVSLSWIAPANDGGSPITSYTVVTYIDSAAISTTSVSGTSATITGLTNGAAYTFTVAARSAAGTGPAATASAAVAVTPRTVPGTPTAVTATAGNGQATVSWAAPADNGGSPVTSYTVTAFSGPAAVSTLTATGTSATISGLANGTAYTFTVAATNVAGTGPASRSTAVTLRTVPGAPTAVTATPGKSQVALTWAAPIDNGGSPITSYTVTTYNGATIVKTLVATTTAVTVTGLTNGTTYTFAVAATNAAGTGPATMSVAVSPRASAGEITDAPSATTDPVPNPTGTGYWMLDTDGTVYAFGDARNFGDPGGTLGPVVAVDLAPTTTGAGYLVVDGAGHVYGYGDARWLGNVDTGLLAAGERAISLSATRSGNGYWVFTTRGRVIAFGDAPFFGDMSGHALNQSVIDSVPTASGQGYYMVASDGGIFAFGDAGFHGSMGATPLNAPIMSLVPTAGGGGYWLVASDGGIFAFGDATFRGSLAEVKLNKPITGMVRYGSGYLMVAEDGGVFDFSGAGGFRGSLANQPPARPIKAVATLA